MWKSSWISIELSESNEDSKDNVFDVTSSEEIGSKEEAFYALTFAILF